MKTTKKSRESELKSELINALIGLTYIVILFMIIMLLRLNRWQIIALICSINLIFMIYTSVKKKQPFSIKKFVKNSLFITIFILVLGFLARFGVWGYVISILVITTWMLTKRWKRYMKGLRRLEAMIYGKPLDNDLWKKGEFKNRSKKKIVWRKKHVIRNKKTD